MSRVSCSQLWNLRVPMGSLLSWRISSFLMHLKCLGSWVVAGQWSVQLRSAPWQQLRSSPSHDRNFWVLRHCGTVTLHDAAFLAWDVSLGQFTEQFMSNPLKNGQSSCDILPIPWSLMVPQVSSQKTDWENFGKKFTSISLQNYLYQFFIGVMYIYIYINYIIYIYNIYIIPIWDDLPQLHRSRTCIPAIRRSGRKGYSKPPSGVPWVWGQNTTAKYKKTH